jgi:hypothetical protein
MATAPSHLAGRSVRAKDEALFGKAARAIAKIKDCVEKVGSRSIATRFRYYYCALSTQFYHLISNTSL